MPSIVNFVALATVLAAGLTSASPLTSRQSGCHPNFEGTGVSVVNSALEWGLPSAPGQGSAVISQAATPDVAEWRFAFSGAPANTHTIKSLQVPQSPELVVAAGSASPLQLLPEVLSTVSPDQAWDVQCNTCQTGGAGFTGLYASGCTIKSVSKGQCVQIDATSGQQLSLAGCDAQPHQLFDFHTKA